MRSPVSVKDELPNANSQTDKAKVFATDAPVPGPSHASPSLPPVAPAQDPAPAKYVEGRAVFDDIADMPLPIGDVERKDKPETASAGKVVGIDQKQEQGPEAKAVVPEVITTRASTPPGTDSAPEAQPDSSTHLLNAVPPPRRASPKPLPVDLAPRVTIAERRAMVLPSPNGPLSSPFDNGKVRRDPRPTAGSTADTNDADSDYVSRAVKKAKKAQPKLTNAERLAVLVGGIKIVQQKSDIADIETPLADNLGMKVETSSRAVADVSGDDLVLDALRETERQESETVKRVGKEIARGLQKERTTDASLRAVYHELQKEWIGHCEYLDGLMAKRGPPPADLYAIPSSLLPALPPVAGPLPLTPVEDVPTRGSRRRGGIYGDMVSTEADFEAILAEFADDAAKDPNLRASKTTAVVPDMMTPRERKLAYDDENDIVDDPLTYYDYAGTAEPIWTDEERAAFLKRYLSYPKQFGKIAEVLENKTAAQCVAYYYRTKKDVDYKGMLASKRGDKKKKALPIKSSGKSSALLSNLGQQKPTVNPATTPGPRSNIIPSAKKDETASVRRKVRESAASTPGVEGLNGRRKKSDTLEEGGADNSAVPSRAGSETPSIAKSKMRMSVKGAKRPRMSSMTEFPPLATAPAVVPPEDSSGPTTATATAAGGTAPTTATATTAAAPATTTPGDLLPPMKRSGKRRKVDPNDPNAPPEEKVTEPRPGRRPTTNSYWSVEEKKKFRELVVSHGTDAKAIAAELVGKSERQVQNFWEAHREDMNLDFLAKGGEEALAEVRRVNGATEKPDTKPVSPASRAGEVETDAQAVAIGQGQPASYGRSIYDVYSGRRPSEAFEQRFAEPRLGMFPPTAQPQAVANGTGDSAPVSRSGGMRISALLNDEPTATSHRDPSPVILPSMSMVTRDVDAASDGTVSERDAEGGIIARPSPRGIPPVPGPAYPSSYDPARAPDAYDRRDPAYRASTAQPAPYPPEHSVYYAHQPPPRAATAAPTLPPRQYEYGRDPHPHSYYSHPPPPHSRSYPPPAPAQVSSHPGHPPQPHTLHAAHAPHAHPAHSAPPPSRPTQPHPSHATHPAHPSHPPSNPVVHAPTPQHRQYHPAPAHEWRRDETRLGGPPGPPAVPPPNGLARPAAVYESRPHGSMQ
jgi:hypothetical protein